MPALTRKIWATAVAASDVHKNRDPAFQLGDTLAKMYASDPSSTESGHLDTLLERIDRAESETRRNGG